MAIESEGNINGYFFLTKMMPYVWDYFYTEQEVRKMKLKRLENESR